MSNAVRTLLLAALLAVATLASYAPTFSAGFADIDDADYVPENEAVKAGLGVDGVLWAFGDAHAGNWFPLTWLSHMADVELFGVDPKGHHAANVALHAVNVALLFAMLASITGAWVPSFVVAGLFALHPVNVESVAWISQRKTTLSTLFGILTIWTYARYARSRTRGAYAASLALFACSLLSKQMFVTLPFALLLLDYWPLRRRELAGDPASARSLARGLARLVPEKLPYLLLAAAASVATLLAQGEAIDTGATFPLAVRLGNAVVATVRYLATCFWPARLAVFYPLYEDEVTLPLVLACGALLLGISGAAVVLGRRHRHLLTGWFWFLGTLVPVIGVVQVGAQAMADRYAYVPFWGLFVAVVWTGWEFVRTRDSAPLRAACGAAVVLLLAGLGALTFRQSQHWRDSIALFEAAIAADGRNYVAHRALAGQYFNRGDYARALRHAEAGAAYPRDRGEILPIYGMALYQTGAKARAIETLTEATRVAPEQVMGFTNLGWVYLQEGDPVRASEVLRAATAVDPRSSRAASLLATSALRQGRLAEAAESLARVVALDPLDFDARIQLARVLAQDGRVTESAASLRDAIAAARDFPEDRRAALLSTLHQYLGDVLKLAGDGAGAVAAYERALEHSPDNYGAHNNLALLLATDASRRDAARAVALAERAVALSQRRKPEALGTLAAAYDAAGRRDDAAGVAREALALARETGNAAAIGPLEAQLRDYTQ